MTTVLLNEVIEIAAVTESFVLENLVSDVCTVFRQTPETFPSGSLNHGLMQEVRDPAERLGHGYFFRSFR